LLSFKIKDIQSARQYLWMKPGDIISVLPADPFYVMGNVNKPGMFFLRGPTTLTQALATAEGFKPASKKDNIRILRQKAGSNEREDLVFNLKDIENKKIQDPLLEPNDIVAVSQDKVKSIVNGVTKSISNGLGNLPLIIP
jgi:protein involved in polysaccharide export with SLBB domain